MELPAQFSLYDTLNQRQKECFSMVMEGQNVFLTGEAGTGKSYFVMALDAYCRDHDITMIKTAPTGRAAINIGGVTLHHQFGLKVGYDFNRAERFSKKWEFLMFTDILLIDEISMVRIDIFDKLMSIIQVANEARKRKRMKPVQLIFVGDFYQLPPVLTRDDKRFLTDHYKRSVHKGYCFQSRYWKMFNIRLFSLDEVLRQRDLAFCEALDKCKKGDANFIPFVLEMSSKKPIQDAIWVCGLNDTADEKNLDELAKLPGNIVSHKAIYKGAATKADNLCADELHFKIGAKVVMTINDNENHIYQNGSIGTIVGMTDGSFIVEFKTKAGPKKVYVGTHIFQKNEYRLEFPNMPEEDLLMCVKEIMDKEYRGRFPNGIEVASIHGNWKAACSESGLIISLDGKKKATLTVDEDGSFEIHPSASCSALEVTTLETAFVENGVKLSNGSIKKAKKSDRVIVSKEIGSAEQYPMRLGYAVTIHKAQGQTYDAMNLIPEIFDVGQLYVALSRCRSIENLYIQGGLSHEMCITSEEVLHFYSDPENYSFFDNTDGMETISIPKKYIKRVKELIAQWESEAASESSQPDISSPAIPVKDASKQALPTEDMPAAFLTRDIVEAAPQEYKEATLPIVPDVPTDIPYAKMKKGFSDKWSRKPEEVLAEKKVREPSHQDTNSVVDSMLKNAAEMGIPITVVQE